MGKLTRIIPHIVIFSVNDMTIALAEFYSAEIRLANTYNGLLIIGYLENDLTMNNDFQFDDKLVDSY